MLSNPLLANDSGDVNAATKETLLQLLTNREAKAEGNPRETGDAKNEDNAKVDNAKVDNAPEKEKTKEKKNKKIDEAFRTKVMGIIEGLDNPKEVLNELIANGTLELTPNDIKLLRVALDIVDQAENAPIYESKIINGTTPIDHRDRYKTYNVTVNRTGLTIVEFHDASAAPWEIKHFTPSEYFKINKGYTSNTLEISPEVSHATSNIFVTLNGYPNPIQFNIKYKNEYRDGLSTFTLAYMSPSTIAKIEGSKGEESIEEYDIFEQQPATSVDMGDKKTIPYRLLQQFASTGAFPLDEFPTAQKVVTTSPEICEIWFVNNSFLIRTNYIYMAGYGDVVMGGGGNNVYVSKNLDSSITFNVAGTNKTVLIPDYSMFANEISYDN